MARVYNFSAGPSMLPESILNRAAAEMLDYEGKQLYFEYIFKESSEFSSIQRAENLEFLSAEGTLFLINN